MILEKNGMCAAIIGKLLKGIIKLQGRKSLPIIDGELKAEGLAEPVEIIRDKWGVPHIYAKNNEDLFFAFGFVHAQDRFWQMELLRRIAAGTMSEMLGKDLLDTDRTVRTFGINRLARRELDASEPGIKALFQAYTNGVNAWLTHPSTRLPVEFGLIKHKPGPWTALDSAALGCLIIWQMHGDWVLEPLLAGIANMVGLDAVKELDPDYDVNPGSIQGGFDVNVLLADGKFKAIKGPYLKQGGGSNSWAVSGSRTKSGKPIHMCDPHLGPTTPAVWYVAHLVGGDFNVTGVSLPGLPLIPMGHNARCSWSACVSYIDANDLYVEKFNPDNPLQYKYKDEWVDAEVIEERINIKGEPAPFIEKVVFTRHGPVISGIQGLKVKDSPDALAFCSVTRDPSNLLRGAFKLMKLRNWDDFIDAGKDLELFFMHVTYADVDGNIGSHILSRAPQRKPGHSGLVPVPGWTGEYDWDAEYIPFDEMPHCLNPKKGFIVISNNKPFEGKEYPHKLGCLFDAGYRARRITSVIEEKGKDKIGVDDLLPLHVDFTSLPGKDFVQRLEHFETSDPDAKLAIEMLRTWNGVLSVDSTGGAVCELALYFTLKRIFEASLDTTMIRIAMGDGFHPMLKTSQEYYYSNYLILLHLLDAPGSTWVTKAGGKQAVIEHGLKEAVRYLMGKLGKDPARWQWGKINKITYPHAFAMKKPMDAVFNSPTRPMGGDTYTVCQSSSPAGGRWGEKIAIPSFRMALDWADPSAARFVYAPGQSGHLASPHYMDLYDKWLNGEYIPMLWTKEQALANKEGTLVLSS
jgi:penicillin amidase